VVICANETAEIFRYTDEANLTEICKFEVDLSALPGFQSNGFFGARNFYTGKHLLQLYQRKFTVMEQSLKLA